MGASVKVRADRIEIRKGLLRRRTETIAMGDVLLAEASGPAHRKLRIRTSVSSLDRFMDRHKISHKKKIIIQACVSVIFKPLGIGRKAG